MFMGELDDDVVSSLLTEGFLATCALIAWVPTSKITIFTLPCFQEMSFNFGPQHLR